MQYKAFPHAAQYIHDLLELFIKIKNDNIIALLVSFSLETITIVNQLAK